MPALAREESSNCTNPTLDIFSKINGVDVDIFSAEFQIFEKVSNPGTPQQTFPATPGTRQVVNVTDNCPIGHRLGTGHYVADYTVPVTEIVGTHEIRWFIRYQSGSSEQEIREEFEVLAASQISPSNLYCTVTDIRNEGYTAQTDQSVLSAIELWQEVFERACRQWFRAETLVLDVDGTGSDALFFGVPIIEITDLKINRSAASLTQGTDYEVYNSRRYPDDRKNPRIKLSERYSNHRDIFTAPMTNGRPRFLSGRKNQHVEGTFGYLEPDGSTPKAVKRAVCKLVIEKLSRPLVANPSATEPPPILSGVVLEEWTDGHKVKYGEPGGGILPRKQGLSGITSDPEILDIIKLYRSPIGIAAPVSPSWS